MHSVASGAWLPVLSMTFSQAPHAIASLRAPSRVPVIRCTEVSRFGIRSPVGFLLSAVMGHAALSVCSHKVLSGRVSTSRGRTRGRGLLVDFC